MKFDFKIIPHKRQRYETVGDYFRKRAIWHFRVSCMKDRRYPWLVFLHEMIEWSICRLTNVSMKAIDRFDMHYEQARSRPAVWGKRAPCGCEFYEEPGDDPHSPYHDAHMAATACEKIIAKALGVRWSDYEDAIGDL